LKDVSTILTGNATRPGFNTTLYVGYKNVGSVNADATLSLTYDPSLTYIESSADFVTHVDNILEWHLTDLKPQERGYISVLLNIPSTQALGTSLKSMSSIEELIDETDFI
jgi:hypothetical protein